MGNQATTNTAHKKAEQAGRVRRFTGLALALTMGMSLSACGRMGDDFKALFGSGTADAYSCPRPSISGPNGSGMDGFNGQEQQLRELRRAAFSADFFAQLSLSDRYSAVKATDKNIEDPIESASWLVLALSNSSGFEPMNRYGEGHRPMSSRYDKCRAYERANAYKRLDEQLGMMDSEERDKVRNRAIYVLSTQGAEGFRTLARLYDNQYGPMGEPADDPTAVHAMMKNSNDARRNVRTLFLRNDVDAYLYNYKAASTGDVSADVLLKDFERSAPSREAYSAFVEAKAKRWVAPYEIYPPEASPSGALPHSDESRRSDAAQYALSRINIIPFAHVAHALKYLGIAPVEPKRPEDVSHQTIEALRAMLGVGGAYMDSPHLLTGDSLRAIQLASIYGDAKSQLVLAVMYSEGVGVPVDYARAFYWYQQSAKQGSGEARYAMSTYFSLGLAGVSDQNRAEAVVLKVSSALAGFRPSVERLRAVLAQVAHSPGRYGGPQMDPAVTASYDQAADAQTQAADAGREP